MIDSFAVLGVIASLIIMVCVSVAGFSLFSGKQALAKLWSAWRDRNKNRVPEA